MKSLSGWQRIGIFLSVIWFLVVLPRQTTVECGAAEARYWTCHNIDASRFSEEECMEACYFTSFVTRGTLNVSLSWQDQSLHGV